jgi:polyisoprenoid-binding protein YceI
MKSKHCLLALAIVLSLLLAQSAGAGELFRIDPTHSTIAFKVRHFFGTAKGKFTNFSGTIDIDREHAEKSSVTATIQVASIDTAIAQRDNHLRDKDFFDVQQFPNIAFKSRRVKQTGPNAGEIAGDLTMRGVTREITLRVELLGDPESAAKNQITRLRVTTAPIKRSQFGLVWSKTVEAVSMIGDEVAIDIQIAATRVK